MTELPPLPEPVVVPAGRRWPSLVWAIPVVALLIGLSLVVEALWQRGPSITVSFVTAEGIEPGKTKVKYKAVDIGEVRSIQLSPDRTHVAVTIELVKSAAQFAVADSRFWVVRPRFAGTGVSGLGTLLSGSYIGVDAGHSEEARSDFTGLEEPPVVASDQVGRRFTLEAEDIGSLDIGSPVYFRHIQVGHVEQFTLMPDGRKIALGVFVKSPYDHFVTTASRFWHASGIDVSVDSEGFKLETQSLATILLGGVAFDTPSGSDNPEPATEGADFRLAASRVEALKTPDGQPVAVLLRFHQSVRGLSVGAPVDFRGIQLGQVRSVGLSYEPASRDFSSPVWVDIYPDRLAAAGASLGPKGAPDAARLALLGDLVQRGLRAQLRPGNLLTGQLFVALDFFPEASQVRLDPRAKELELPTVQGNFEEMQQRIETILRRLEQVPFETLGQDAHQVMTGLTASLKHIDGLVAGASGETLPQLRDSLAEMTRTLQSLQATLAADAPMQQDTRRALQGVAEAARSLKTLTDSLDRQPESLLRGRQGDNR
ncbi:MAG: MCE family protein [Telmatospirillum sp.]|nr:MCE family protein [Telmatospirillum sp.]